ncbi:hypothetical protein [Hyphomicrobium sp.]|uniref:hypothetical protein n=1 Tax=Hyphomicrobium sp. TaxID=82 RepID=UPI00356AC3AC
MTNSSEMTELKHDYAAVLRERMRVQIDQRKVSLKTMLATDSEPGCFATAMNELAIEWRIENLGIDFAQDLGERQLKRLLKKYTK